MNFNGEMNKIKQRGEKVIAVATTAIFFERLYVSDEKYFGIFYRDFVADSVEYVGFNIGDDGIITFENSDTKINIANGEVIYVDDVPGGNYVLAFITESNGKYNEYCFDYNDNTITKFKYDDIFDIDEF